MDYVSYLIIRLAEVLLKELLKVFSLPLTESLVKAWTRCYTSVATESEREARRDEIHSDLHEHKTACLDDGLDGPETARQILGRALRGAKQDVHWAVPYLPGTIAGELEQASDYLERLGAPKSATSMLAMFFLMNFGVLSLPAHERWPNLLIVYFGLVGAGIILRYSERPRAQAFLKRIEHPISIGFGILTVTAVVTYIWAVVHLRLYEDPLSYQVPLSMLPLLVMVGLATPQWRNRLFGGRWKAVLFAYCVIVPTSIAAVLVFTDDPVPLLSIWSYLVMGAGVLIGALLICVLLAEVLWRGGIKVSVASMRLAARGIRVLG